MSCIVQQLVDQDQKNKPLYNNQLKYTKRFYFDLLSTIISLKFGKT